MKSIAHMIGVGSLLFMSTLLAGSLTVPNTFVSGTTISSSEMNANFDEVETQVTDNSNRLDALEAGGPAPCPAGMNQVGPICVDIYEASIWDAATGGTLLDNSGCNDPAFAACVCSPTGNDCSIGQANPIFARSVAATQPGVAVTWFMAQQACFNVGKRLLTSAEWQAAAAGTPDPGAVADGADPNGVATCNTDNALAGMSGPPNFAGVVPTGNSAGQAGECISNWGIFDMTGNVVEWVADWVVDNGPEGATAGATFGDDSTLVSSSANGGAAAGAAGNNNGQVGGSTFPGAVIRGGDRNDRTGAGIFHFDGSRAPSHTSDSVGFRCAI